MVSQGFAFGRELWDEQARPRVNQRFWEAEARPWGSWGSAFAAAWGEPFWQWYLGEVSPWGRVLGFRVWRGYRGYVGAI